MGKVAKNEQIKLEAAFYNNVAVGVFIGGAFIPTLSIYYASSSLAEILERGQFNRILPTVVAMFIAFIFASGARLYANHILTKIKD
jgi:hypothetical protein